ncbi:TPA: Arc family DNA-binding protein [Morganella morganii]
MAKYPSQLQDKFNLRLPDGMKDAIAERADKYGRSMNSEIIQILSDKLSGPESLQVDIEFHKLFKEITESEACDGYNGFTHDDFNEKYTKIDLLIDILMKRMESDNNKIKDLLNMKRGLLLKK